LFSVLRQEGVDLEVLVVDDGSTEHLRGTVDELNDPRVRLLRHEPPQGVSIARNRGVAEAGGRWVAFVDDDDLWAPHKLVMQLRAAEGEGRGWAYAGSVNVSEDLRVLGGAPPAEPEDVVAALPRVNLIPGGCSGVVARRELLPPEPFDPSYRHFADWDLWIRLSHVDRPAAVRHPLVGYRVHSGNRSLDTAGMVAELDEIEKRYGGPVDRSLFYRHVARVSLRASRYRAAVGYYVRAAGTDRHYIRREFAADVIEVAQEAARGLRHRFSRVLGDTPTRGRTRRPQRRYAAQRPWVEQARPWLDELARHQSDAARRGSSGQ
jgi:glycosyltransferase involved in cell wall biosynthesis